jgi:hypothetical protein
VLAAVTNAASIARETAYPISVTQAANWIFRRFSLGTRALSSAVGPIAAAEIWSRWTNELFNPYRPELHYMRGPGPKWRQKHAQAKSD